MCSAHDRVRGPTCGNRRSGGRGLKRVAAGRVRPRSRRILSVVSAETYDETTLDTFFSIRVRASQLAMWRAGADYYELSLSDFVRTAVDYFADPRPEDDAEFSFG